MWQFPSRASRKLYEHIGLWLIGWLLGGAVFLLTGVGPEEWYPKLFEKLHVSGYVASFWPAGWDIRLVPVIIGMSMITGGALWYYHQRRPAAEVPAQPVAPAPLPILMQPVFNITAPGPAPAIAREPAAHPGDKPTFLPYPSLGPLFKGRGAFLHRLHESLTRADGTTTAIVSQALYGLGGIGKTRAAVEYAWTHRADYAAVLFVQADSPEALHRNLAALTGPLALPEHEATDEQVRLHAVLAWLRARPGWLLILDNVDTTPALNEAERLMGQLAGGHVLLTSRLDRFAPNVQPLELDVLAPDDAVAFLLERTPRRRHAADDAAEAQAVAEELGRLALALEQAGATIDHRRCGFADYLTLWRGSRDNVLGWARPEITGYPRAVAVTWQASVEQLTGPGRHLLERLAWLAPDPVPEFLLDVPITGVAADQREALLDLAAYSLVTRDPERERFAVHRLVQDATRRSLDAAAARQRLGEALGWVNDAFTGEPQDVRSWPRLDPLAPHALTVAQHSDSAGIAEPTAWLMNHLGLLFRIKALHAQAEPLLRRALAINEASLGDDHPNVAACLNNLSQLLQATNRFAEAEPLMRRALAIDEARFGEDHPNVATRLNNLALMLQSTSRLAEAEPLFRRALAINEASFGKNHPTVAISLNNLTGLLRDTDRLVEAEPLYRRALAIDEASFRKDHPNVARDLNNLAGLLRATKRLAEAEPLYRRALAINEASFGKDHPNVATGLNNLGGLLQATNRLAEAEPLYRRALAIGEASFGKDHPEVAVDLNNLAALLYDTNRFAEAEPLFRRALAIFLDFERATGHPHLHRDTALDNYTDLLKAMGKSEAEIRAAIATLTGTT
jgi:tetratricopeptide (TPR) repeat protein